MRFIERKANGLREMVTIMHTDPGYRVRTRGESHEAEQTGDSEGLLTMGATGLSALIRTGAVLKNDLGLETLSIGCPENAPGDCAMETAGRFLLYTIGIHNEEIRVGASLMDSPAATQTLLRCPDSEAGWQLITRFVGALEQHEIKALHPRPRSRSDCGVPTVLSSREGQVALNFHRFGKSLMLHFWVLPFCSRHSRPPLAMLAVLRRKVICSEDSRHSSSLVAV